MLYTSGERIEVISGTYRGKTGEFKKYPSKVFPEWCYVTFDLGPRERVQKTHFIELKNIQPMAKINKTDTDKKSKNGKVTHIDVSQIPDYTMDSGIINIDLDCIIPDPNQPRKFFNEDELLELAQSIIQVGVIEPILVRPVGEDKYMVVFGERRFRACTIARTTQEAIITVPAMVRDLTDDEALELQITENSQRHDPHPMEDAASYEKMLVKYDVKEIAARMGKSTKFIAGRLLLTKLLPEFQEMFFRGCMDMQDATLLSKASTETQQVIYNERVRANWREIKNYEMQHFQYILNKVNQDLDKAPFKTEDAALYLERGACNTCPFNSINTLLAFTDEGRVCSDNTCYSIKCDRSFKQNIEEVLTDPSVVFIANETYNNKDQAKVEEVKKMGMVVLNENDWDTINDEEKPTYEVIKEDLDIDYEDWGRELEEDEEPTEAEIDAKVKENLAEAIKEWQEGQDEIKASRKAGRIKKAFVLTGSSAGKFTEVIITERGEKKEQATSSKDADQIGAIEKREARAKELDAEKVWEQVRVAILADDKVLFKHGGELMDTENRALLMALYESLDYHHKDYFCEEVLKSEEGRSYGSNVIIGEAIKKMTTKKLENALNICSRLLMAEKLITSGGSHLTASAKYWGHKLAYNYIADQVKTIELEQQEKTTKRQQRVKERISELQNENA